MFRWITMTACLILVTTPVLAQDGGISITGSASTMVDPDAVKISFKISADAEEAKDAVVEYLKKEQRVLEGLEKIKKDDLSIQISGLTFGAGGAGGMAQMMRMGGGEESAATLSLARDCMVTITKIDLSNLKGIYERIAEVIDAGKEAGAEMGGGATPGMFGMGNGAAAGPVQFVVTKLDEVRTQVSAEALADAKKNAQLIADQMGIKLGRVQSVSDAAQAADSQDGMNAYMGMLATMFGGEKKAPESLKVEVSVKYAVRFAIGE